MSDFARHKFFALITKYIYLSKQKTKKMSEKQPMETMISENELISRSKLNGTPFTIVREKENYFLALGKYRLTEMKDSKTELLDELITDQYNIILNMIQVVVETMIKEENNNNNK